MPKITLICYLESKTKFVFCDHRSITRKSFSTSLKHFWDFYFTAVDCLTNFGHNVRYIILETFFYSGSLSFDIYKSQTSIRAGRPILTPFYHIHPFHEHLNIRWAIIAERSSLHISSGRTRTGNLWFLSQVVNQIRFKYIRKMIDCSINEYYTDFIALQFSAHLKFADSDDQCAVITKWILAFNEGHASLQRTTFIKSPALWMKDLDMTKFINWTALW